VSSFSTALQKILIPNTQYLICNAARPISASLTEPTHLQPYPNPSLSITPGFNPTMKSVKQKVRNEQQFTIRKGDQMDFSVLLKAQWKQMRGKVKEQWGNLTDDDLDKVDGQFDQLVGVIMEKYELTRSKAEAEITKLLTGK
jgi:uncharacterized protein YjbJ (UPF0337 family)